MLTYTVGKVSQVLQQNTERAQKVKAFFFSYKISYESTVAQGTKATPVFPRESGFLNSGFAFSFSLRMSTGVILEVYY